jgi:hypothetical protein
MSCLNIFANPRYALYLCVVLYTLYLGLYLSIRISTYTSYVKSRVILARVRELNAKDSQTTLIGNHSTDKTINNSFKKKPRIFCIINTNPHNFKTKTSAIQSIWAYKCDNYRFFSTLPNINLTQNLEFASKIIHPDGYGFKETHDDLTDKIYSSFRYVFKKFEGYDWYLKSI